MKFGIIKSKIENVLLESYKSKTFNNEFKTFKKLVLENKNISKLYYLYDELSSNKGLTNDIVDSYINECVTIYENTVNKIGKEELNKLNSWVSKQKSENLYESIDQLFSNDVLKITSKIEGRKTISENLKKQPVIKNTSVSNVPLKTMFNIVNKTANNYIDSLNESDRKELTTLLSEKESVLSEKYDLLKEDTISKLNQVVNEENDGEVQSKIEQTIKKLQEGTFSKLEYYRLTKLNENI